jgi:hypothetical protein
MAERVTKMRHGFDELLMQLTHRFGEVPRAVRMQSLLVAALAMVDASSIEERKGVVTTEAEFLELCRRVYRKVRGTSAARLARSQ